MSTWFTLLIVAVGLERLLELRISRRHLAWSLQHGGRVYGGDHYLLMVALHVFLLVGSVVEVWLFARPFLPWLGWPMLALVVASQALRWWCIRTLRTQWNTRVVVVPDLPRVRNGPYRWLRHPNYLAVVVEGFALPLVHTAWITAAIFSVADAMLLRVRVRVENTALASLTS